MIEEIKVAKWINEPNVPITKNGADAEDVARLQELFLPAGMSKSKFYSRVKYIGFDEWEMRGMCKCIEDYVAVYNEQVSAEDTIYLLRDIDPSEFWQMLCERGAITQFSMYMKELGMSVTTLRRRMQNGDFMDWEWEGVAGVYRRQTPSNSPFMGRKDKV